MPRVTKLRPAQAAAPVIAAIPPADVLGRLAALKSASVPELKGQWQQPLRSRAAAL